MSNPPGPQFIFDEWHNRIKARDGEGLSKLYARDAVLESPLVPRVLDTDTGALHGHEAISHFLLEITMRRPGEDELPSLFRTGKYFWDGHTLIWEYPRSTPDGNQLDLVEVMEIDESLITYHRIYWGWVGTEHLLNNAVAKHETSPQRAAR